MLLALSALWALVPLAAAAQAPDPQREPLQLWRQPKGLSAVSRLQFFEDTTRALTIDQVRTPAQEARFR